MHTDYDSPKVGCDSLMRLQFLTANAHADYILTFVCTTFVAVILILDSAVHSARWPALARLPLARSPVATIESANSACDLIGEDEHGPPDHKQAILRSGSRH
jgi:hypothetical protein